MNELDQLASIKTLRNLSLLRNPVASVKQYRLYCIYRMPQLRILDFKKIKDKERKEAQIVFKGKKLKKNANAVNVFTPGEQITTTTTAAVTNQEQQYQQLPLQQQQQQRMQPTKEDIEAIRVCIYKYVYKCRLVF